MKPKQCENCKRPLNLKIVCRWCGHPVDPLKTETIILVLGGVLLVGVIIGSLI